MPLADLPPGVWTRLLIGDQWPSSRSLAVLSASRDARLRLSSQFERYGEHLRTISMISISSQAGVTAEEAQAAFQHGVVKAYEVAEDNTIKHDSYRTAIQSATEFRTTLADLAATGNRQIDQINISQMPIPEKVDKITQVISEIRSHAALEAAKHAGQIYSAIQAILTSRGLDNSATIFAADNGFGSTGGSPGDLNDLRDEIGRKLLDDSLGPTSTSKTTDAGFVPPAQVVAVLTNPGGSPTALPTGIGRYPSSPNQEMANGPLPPHTPSLELIGLGQADNFAAAGSPPNGFQLDSTAHTPTASLTATGFGTSSTARLPAGELTSPAAPSPSTLGVANTPSFTAPSSRSISAMPTIEAAAPSALPSQAIPGAFHPPTTFSPEHLAETFNAGAHAGTPVSAAAEAISHAAASPVHTPHTALSAPLEPAVAATPLFETAHAGPVQADAVPQIASAPSEIAHPVIAPAPAIAPAIQAPTISPAVQPTPQSGLLAYGADVRPPIATAPTAPPIPPAALPGSAPVNTAGTGQPALVRQQPTTPPPQAPAGLTERAVVATAAGAAAGAAAEHSAAADRLRRLLDAVARQQPRLRWAIGDLEDGSTLLVTDLACGWIPPGVEIPAGVGLLRPATRRGDLTALLGSATRIAAYQPGQYVAPPEAASVATSVRSRDTAAVDDLGWELAQATKWRDGLPRLAHTLAKAVSSGTGVLDNEAELLRDHLADVAGAVVDAYPAAMDRSQVGNWQLLATIDALIVGEKRLANYHFAWFQAHALTREGRR